MLWIASRPSSTARASSSTGGRATSTVARLADRCRIPSIGVVILVASRGARSFSAIVTPSAWPGNAGSPSFSEPPSAMPVPLKYHAIGQSDQIAGSSELYTKLKVETLLIGMPGDNAMKHVVVYIHQNDNIHLWKYKNAGTFDNHLQNIGKTLCLSKSQVST